jgi:hypothetical protein
MSYHHMLLDAAPLVYGRRQMHSCDGGGPLFVSGMPYACCCSRHRQSPWMLPADLLVLLILPSITPRLCGCWCMVVSRVLRLHGAEVHASSPDAWVHNDACTVLQHNCIHVCPCLRQ